MRVWAWANKAYGAVLAVCALAVFVVAFLLTAQQVGWWSTLKGSPGPSLTLLPVLLWFLYWRRPPQRLKPALVWVLITFGISVLLLVVGDPFVASLMVLMLFTVGVSEGLRLLVLLWSQRPSRSPSRPATRATTSSDSEQAPSADRRMLRFGR